MTLSVHIHKAKPTAKALGTLVSAGSTWKSWFSLSIPFLTHRVTVKIKHECYTKIFAYPTCSNSEGHKMLYLQGLSHPQEVDTVPSKPHSIDYRGPKSFSNALEASVSSSEGEARKTGGLKPHGVACDTVE